MVNNLKLSCPWDIFVKQLRELFMYDEEIHVSYDINDRYNVKILVDSEDKYNALNTLMPKTKMFGNVPFTIEVVPSNKDAENDKLNLFQAAFRDNPVFSKAISRPLPDGGSVVYALFKPNACQYYTDNFLMDPYGNSTQLYENIARDVFGVIDGVKFSSDLINE